MAISRIKQGLMTLAILIVLTFFVFYAIEVFYEAPQYDDFCDKPRAPKLVEQTQEFCEQVDGEWQSYDNVDCPPDARECPTGYCNIHAKCSKEYDAVKDVYERNVFFTSIVIGLILLFSGLALKGVSVSTGIMGGGVVTLFIALARYWGMLSKYLRLVILALILVLLIWVGYTKIDKLKDGDAGSRPSSKKRISSKKAKRKASRSKK